MSLAKIHAFTAWLNFRLDLEKKDKLSNVLTDLFQDFHWQHLLEILTGSSFKKIGTFSGISQVQKTTRIEWIEKDLKSWHILGNDVSVNCKLVAARNSHETFSLLFKLVCEDILFLWKRITFLQMSDAKLMSKYKFKIKPEKQGSAKPKKFKVKKDLLAGFGASSQTFTELPDEDASEQTNERIFLNEAEMVSVGRASTAAPEGSLKPMNCLLSMIKTQIKTSKAGKGIKVEKLSDLCDVKVLCALINSVIPNSFSPEVLPNDRYAINLLLKFFENVLHLYSDFDATDLNSNDQMAIATYITTVFLALFQFKQCLMVLQNKDDLEYTIRKLTLELELYETRKKCDETIHDSKHRKQIQEAMSEFDDLKERFDIPLYLLWKMHQEDTLKETLQSYRKKIDEKFEVMNITTHTTIGDLCSKCFINTKLMKSSGFYQINSKETVTEDREMILLNTSNGKFITDLKGSSRSKVRNRLQVLQVGPVDIDPTAAKARSYEVFVESFSKNKYLEPEDKFLYTLFQDTRFYWNLLLLKGGADSDVTIVKMLMELFADNRHFVNWQHPETGDSALHIASVHGNFDTMLCLLEYGADVNLLNRLKLSPLHNVVELGNEKAIGLLLEWGADIHQTNVRNETVLDFGKNKEITQRIQDKFEFYKSLSEKTTSANLSQLETSVSDHRTKSEPVFVSLRSRCIQGSTLLHSAAHFSNVDVVKELLILRVNVNQKDYKGASSLHRATNEEITHLLIDAGANVNSPDNELNQPLHAACYGNDNEPDQIMRIQILLNEKAGIVAENSQGLMPIHCAAMQGRMNVIKLLLQFDKNNQIHEQLEMTKFQKLPPSLNYLAVMGGFVACAQWLLDEGFSFKEGEPNQLLKSLIIGDLVIRGKSLDDVMHLLIYKANADMNQRYPPSSQTALHLAAATPDSSEIMMFLINAGADVNATDIDYATPLFVACKKNNLRAAKVLIENDTNLSVKNNVGLAAFDYIADYLEWINSLLFDNDTIARLKAYNLKQTRTTIKTINKQVNQNEDVDNNVQFRQLIARLDRNILEDKIERSKSQLSLRPRSVVQ